MLRDKWLHHGGGPAGTLSHACRVPVDLKAFTDEFSTKICGAHLQPVLDAAVVARELACISRP